MVLLLITTAGAGVPAVAAQKDISLQGKLQLQNGKPVLSTAGGKGIRLTSGDETVMETLSDPEVAGKELKVVGKPGADGSFEVQEFYVVRGNSLYRLIYFCDVCHITTFRPGNCECCQRPTVPTEVPLTDPRVYHEEIKPRD